MPTVFLLFCLATLNQVTQTPQKPAQVQKPVSAAAFKALAGDALLEVEGRKVTKTQLLQKYSRTRALLPLGMLDPAKEIAAMDAKRQTDLAAANAQLERLHFAAVGRGGPSLKAVSSTPLKPGAVSADPLPVVTQVTPSTWGARAVATPGGYIAFKGERLEPFFIGKGGKVLLAGSPLGPIELTPKTAEGSGNGLIVQVPPDLKGLKDQKLSLSLRLPDGRTVQAPGTVDFVAKVTLVAVEGLAMLRQVQVSANASLDNYVSVLPGDASIFVVHHINIPQHPETTGTDVFEVPLANGWAINTFGENLLGEFAKNVKNSTRSGNQLTVHWVAPSTSTLQDAKGVTFYTFRVYVRGPVGVPMK